MPCPGAGIPPPGESDHTDPYPVTAAAYPLAGHIRPLAAPSMPAEQPQQRRRFNPCTVFTGERWLMARCITCGTELHPERALKYDYCMAKECQEKNAKGLTIVAVGQNKAAEQFLILDERTREDLAAGKQHDQRRTLFGPPVPSAGALRAAGTHGPPQERVARPKPRQAPPARRQPWTRSQERLALLYNEQGLRPAEIGGKLRVSPHLVTQIILAAKNRGK
jgi:hypothetical protein